MEYASRGVANTALGLGIAGAVGTAAGLLENMGGLGGLFGGPRPPMDPGDRAVTRYDMDLFQTINAKNVEIAKLESMRYTDAAANGLQQQIGAQAVWNATQAGVLDLLKAQTAQLQGMTKLFIPESNIAIPAAPAVSTGNGASTTSGT